MNDMMDMEQTKLLEQIIADTVTCESFSTSAIQIEVLDITKSHTTCIVNAANSYLQQGGGVCGAIFSAAGSREMQAACDKYGSCPTGSAVITPGFALPAQYVIHAVGPKYRDGRSGEREKLYSCYQASLELALKQGAHSITFPLISSGIYGYPKEEAWTVACQACVDFLDAYRDRKDRLRIVFATLSDSARRLGEKKLEEVYNRYWAKKFEKYVPVMELISQDGTLSEYCRNFNPYEDVDPTHSVVLRWIGAFEGECFRTEFGMVSPDMEHPARKFLHDAVPQLCKDPEAFARIAGSLSALQLRLCIWYHIRAQRFTLSSMENGAGNGIFFYILKEWMRRFAE